MPYASSSALASSRGQPSVGSRGDWPRPRADQSGGRRRRVEAPCRLAGPAGSSHATLRPRARAAFSGNTNDGMPASRRTGGGPSLFMNTATRGTSRLSSAWAATSSVATSEARVRRGVLNMTIRASISDEAPRMRTAWPYCCAVALAIMSTGLDTLASGGSKERRRAAVSSVSWGTMSPLVSQASAARIPGPPPLVRMATRRPRNCRCELNMVATSSISSMESARMTPAWRSRASTATSPAESAAVCDDRRSGAGFCPACLHRHDGDPPADPLGDSDEPPRVLDRLKVEQDQIDIGVLAPVQDQVVAGDVRTVAHRHERADPKPANLRCLQHGESDRA